MKRILTLLFLSLLTLSNCSTKKGDLKAGSICTIENGEGKYAVVKVLVINDFEAHLKLYRNKYEERPVTIDLKTLSMGGIGDKNGFGIGHVPLSREGFEDWKPKTIGFEKVTEDDLYGYNMWQNQ